MAIQHERQQERATHHTDGGDAGELLRFERLLRSARAELGPDVTLQRVLILLNVFLNEGLSQSELLRVLDATSPAALSRNLADLSAWTSRKQPGPGLLELRPDPMNLRRKSIHLTEAGRRLVARITRPASGAA